ncbi:MAG: class I adenylate-forming enzyme family protein [Candidatus Omnitrophota bacterium]
MKYQRYNDFLTGKDSGEPLKSAIIYEGRHISYKELTAHIATCKAYLDKLKIRKGHTVVLMMENIPEFVVCFISVLQRRAIVFPVNPKISTSEIKSLLLESRASHVICTQECYPGNKAFDGTFVGSVTTAKLTQDVLMCKEIYCSKNRKNNPRQILAKKSGDEFCIRQYSSGSTGKPKHVLLTFRNLFYQAFQFTDALCLTEEEIFAAAVPLYHSYGLLNILATFYLRATLLLIKNFLPHKTVDFIATYKATVFLTTPFMLDILANSYNDRKEKNAFKTLYFCVSSTGLLRKEIYKNFHKRYKVPVFVQYGSTETGAATIRFAKIFNENVVGKPMKQVKIKIFDNNFKHLCKGIGKIGIKSPAACQGYLGNSAQGNASFRRGYVFPGDIGYIDNSGDLHIVGRDDIINVGGFKVDRLEVENVIGSLPGIKEVVVYGVDEGSTQIVRAAIILKKKITERKILAYAKKRLADYKIPKKIIYVEKFPMDEKGKILRQQLEKL